MIEEEEVDEDELGEEEEEGEEGVDEIASKGKGDGGEKKDEESKAV